MKQVKIIVNESPGFLESKINEFCKDKKVMSIKILDETDFYIGYVVYEC